MKVRLIFSVMTYEVSIVKLLLGMHNVMGGFF